MFVANNIQTNRMSTANFKIEYIHVFVATDPADNSEGVIAYLAGLAWMPLVAADHTRLQHMIKAAEEIKERTGKDYTILRFEKREDVTKEVREKFKISNDGTNHKGGD